jgi:Mrp family chromosome partitioning ATPase
VAATVVGGLVGLWLTDSEPSDYEATSLFVSTVDGPSAGVILNSYATMMGSPSFRDQLATTSGQPIDPTSLEVSVPDSTGLISATVRAATPEQVLAISDQILPTFQQVATDTGPEIDPADALIDVFGAPSVPERDEPSTIWLPVAGALVGFCLALLAVALWPIRRPRGVTDLDQAEAASGIPFRAAIPDLHQPDGPSHVNPHDAAYALLRAGTDRWWRRPVQLIAVVPCRRDRRAYDLALDLAAVATEGGNRALLVDADLAHGGLTRHVGCQDRSGVTDAQVSNGRIQASVTSITGDGRPEIPFLARGTGSTSATPAIIAPLIAQLDGVDVAIAVASPFDEHTPIAELLEVADGILVAGIAGETTRDELVALGDLLRSMATTDRTTGALLGADRLALDLDSMEAVPVG